MRKNIKLSLIFVLILIIICTVVVIFNPLKGKKDNSASTSSVQQTESSVQTADSSESSKLESSIIYENSLDTESSDFDSDVIEISELVSEDQPSDPNLNFETSGASYDDIMVNVLTCLLTQDTEALSAYVGSQGLRLSPTGVATKADIVLSAEALADFFSTEAQTYGIYPGSGEDIYLTPAEYYDNYIVPAGFDFSSAHVSYNDADDLEAVAGYVQDPKTISYKYTPNVMEWKRLILVYGSEGSGDALCCIIYQDVTTN